MKTTKHPALSLIIIFLVLSFVSIEASAAKIPPIPGKYDFIQDYAFMIKAEDKSVIADIQEKAFENYDTPIVVVTINSMADYDASGQSIESLAMEWFNAWEIGKRTEDDRLINKGILLLISKGDRKARIELGADWGRRWDDYTKSIMDDRIIAEFKQGNFSGGIVKGVSALGGMAELDPESKPPQKPLMEEWKDKAENARFSTSVFSGNTLVILFILGVLLIVAGIFTPKFRIPLIIAGIAIIAIALFTWIVIFILFMIAVGKGGTEGSGGGFSSSGGFSTGGFSGGGGASGSW